MAGLSRPDDDERASSDEGALECDDDEEGTAPPDLEYGSDDDNELASDDGNVSGFGDDSASGSGDGSEYAAEEGGQEEEGSEGAAAEDDEEAGARQVRVCAPWQQRHLGRASVAARARRVRDPADRPPQRLDSPRDPADWGQILRDHTYLNPKPGGWSLPAAASNLTWISWCAALRQEEQLDTRNPLARLRYFDLVSCILLDPMHTLGGVAHDVLKLLQGLKELPRVHQYEARVNGRGFGGIHLASASPWLGGVGCQACTR